MDQRNWWQSDRGTHFGAMAETGGGGFTGGIPIRSSNEGIRGLGASLGTSSSSLIISIFIGRPIEPSQLGSQNLGYLSYFQ